MCYRRKIILALTPPSYFKNLGDHGQLVAIRPWLKKHFPEFPVIEVDKDQVRHFMRTLKWLIRPGDIIFLQSGGNLGDRGMWSESGRRKLISTFIHNPIISLPQTIYFSDTLTGQREKTNTINIYAKHPHLTIIARDSVSEKIAQEMFPAAKILCSPDFALSLNHPRLSKNHRPPKILLCLRDDNERALSDKERQAINEKVVYEKIYFDTTASENIHFRRQAEIIQETLEVFSRVDGVVTDRLHGLIFSVVCCRPCVALPSIDHKIRAGIQWFSHLPFIAFAEDVNQIPALLERCLTATDYTVPDWNAEYFDKLALRVRKELTL